MDRLFSIPVYEQKLNLDVDEMIRYCLSMKRKEKSIKKVTREVGTHLF